MSKLLPISIVCLVASIAGVSTATWYRKDVRLNQMRLVRDADFQRNEARNAADKFGGEWSQARLDAARQKAERFHQLRISEAAWEELAVKIRGKGLALEVQDAPAKNEGEGRRLRVTISLGGMQTSDDNLTKFVETMTEMDKTVGGCMRVQLRLSGQTSSTSRLPSPTYSADSHAVYEFTLLKST